MEDNSFQSYDKNTGMLQDIQEIRDLGLILARYLGGIILNPMVRLTLSRGQIYDMVGLTSAAISSLIQTSQADQVRLLGQLLDVPSEEIEQSIKEHGFSETLPSIHPAAPQPELAPLDPNDPMNYESNILKHRLDEQLKGHEEHVKLPDSIETFIQDLLKGE